MPRYRWVYAVAVALAGMVAACGGSSSSLETERSGTADRLQVAIDTSGPFPVTLGREVAAPLMRFSMRLR